VATVDQQSIAISANMIARDSLCLWVEFMAAFSEKALIKSEKRSL
jgi:hypothetical protein